MAGMDWLRWHHGSVTDPKFQLVAKKSGCSVAEVIAFWAFVLESASMADERGDAGSLDIEAIECLLGLEDGKGTLIYSAMQSRDLIDEYGRISSWGKRQPKREREDDSQKRVEKHRANQKEQKEANENHVTPSNASDAQKSTRVEKSREEVNSRGATATRLPADWTPDELGIAFCKSERPDLDPMQTAAHFKDYWVGIGGAKGRKLDWPATWRNWVRSENAPPQKPVAHVMPSIFAGAR